MFGDVLALEPDEEAVGDRVNHFPLTSNVAGLVVEHRCVASELQNVYQCGGRGTSVSSSIFVRCSLLIISLVSYRNEGTSLSVRR